MPVLVADDRILLQRGTPLRALVVRQIPEWVGGLGVDVDRGPQDVAEGEACSIPDAWLVSDRFSVGTQR